MPEPDGAERFVFSVRMRAAAGGPHEEGGRHLSGHERLVPPEEVESVVSALFARARAAGEADFISVITERLPLSAVARARCLQVRTIEAATVKQARQIARRRLESVGVAAAVARQAEALLDGENLSGAVLLDATSGERLEPDPSRGVRVSRFDYEPEAAERVRRALTECGLVSHRVIEALAVASKAVWAGALAELCWSDDPEYEAGYVATAAHGYERFPLLKRRGWPCGGRVFFVPPEADAAALIQRLERAPLWLNAAGFGVSSSLDFTE